MGRLNYLEKRLLQSLISQQSQNNTLIQLTPKLKLIQNIKELFMARLMGLKPSLIEKINIIMITLMEEKLLLLLIKAQP